VTNQPPSQDITIDFGGAYQTVSFQNFKRQIYKNLAPAPLVQYLYEPAFLAQFDAAQSAANKQLCLDVSLDTAAYKAAVMATVAATDPNTVSRIVTGGMVLSLGPALASSPSYTPIAGLTFPDGNDTYLACFSTATTDPDLISAMAATSSLRVTYAIPILNAPTSTCNISLAVGQQSIFSNAINGPVTTAPLPGPSGQPVTVAVTRDQIADAVNKGLLTLTQSCVTTAGATTSSQVAHDSLSTLLPIIMAQLGTQTIAWGDAMKQLANFSFNGADAGTTINSYLQSLSTQVHNSSSGSVKVAANTSANVVGLFSGSAGGSVDTSHADDSLNTSDAKIQWTGTQYVPASLNVVILKSGVNQQVASLSTSETTVLGGSTTSREYVVQVSPVNTATPFSPLVPVGSVMPMYLSSADVAALAPMWLPADGRVVNDLTSPLNKTTLPDLRGVFVLGADAGTSSVIPTDATTTGGSTVLNGSLPVSGGTSTAIMYNQHAGGSTGVAPNFVIDTSVDEYIVADHTHTLSGATAAMNNVPLPLPPYRKLIYMVRCRP
jgi:hypothetical protein